jgi:hypothetical protein
MDPEYGVAQKLANDARRVKTWVEVEKARLTGSGLSEQTEAGPDASHEAGDQFR